MPDMLLASEFFGGEKPHTAGMGRWVAIPLGKAVNGSVLAVGLWVSPSARG